MYNRLPAIFVPEFMCPTIMNKSRKFLTNIKASRNFADYFIKQNMAMIFPIQLKKDIAFININVSNFTAAETGVSNSYGSSKRIFDQVVSIREGGYGYGYGSDSCESSDYDTYAKEAKQRLELASESSTTIKVEDIYDFLEKENVQYSGLLFTELEKLIAGIKELPGYDSVSKNTIIYFTYASSYIYKPKLQQVVRIPMLHLVIKPMTSFDSRRSCSYTENIDDLLYDTKKDAAICVSNIVKIKDNEEVTIPAALKDLFSKKTVVMNGDIVDYLTVENKTCCESCDASLSKAIDDDCSIAFAAPLFPVQANIPEQEATDFAAAVYNKLLESGVADPIDAPVYDKLTSNDKISYKWTEAINSSYTAKKIPDGSELEFIAEKLKRDSYGRDNSAMLQYPHTISNKKGNLKQLTDICSINSYSYHGIAELEVSKDISKDSRKRTRLMKDKHCSKCAIACRYDRAEYKEFVNISEELIRPDKICAVNESTIQDLKDILKTAIAKDKHAIETAVDLHKAFNGKVLKELSFVDRIDYLSEELEAQNLNAMSIEYLRRKQTINPNAGFNIQNIYGSGNQVGAMSLAARFNNDSYNSYSQDNDYLTRTPLNFAPGSIYSGMNTNIKFRYDLSSENSNTYRNTDLFRFFIKYLKKNGIYSEQKLFELFVDLKPEHINDMLPGFVNADKDRNASMSRHIIESLFHFYNICIGMPESYMMSFNIDKAITREIDADVLYKQIIGIMSKMDISEPIQHLIILNTLMDSYRIHGRIRRSRYEEDEDSYDMADNEYVAHRLSSTFKLTKDMFNINKIESPSVNVTMEFININSVSIRREVLSTVEYNQLHRKMKIVTYLLRRKYRGQEAMRRGREFQFYCGALSFMEHINYTDISFKYIIKNNPCEFGKSSIGEDVSNYVEYLAEKNTYAMMNLYMFFFPVFLRDPSVTFSTISGLFTTLSDSKLYKFDETFNGQLKSRIIRSLTGGEEDEKSDINSRLNLGSEYSDSKVLSKVLLNKYKSANHNMILQGVANYIYLRNYVGGMSPSITVDSRERFWLLMDKLYSEGAITSDGMVKYLITNKPVYHWDYVNTSDSGCYNPGYILAYVYKRLKESLTK